MEPLSPERIAELQEAMDNLTVDDIADFFVEFGKREGLITPEMHDGECDCVSCELNQEGAI